MQFIEIPDQLMSILYALLFGAASAAVYDVFRFVRSFFIKGQILVANIADIIYAVCLGSGFSVLLYLTNHGIFRWYIAAGSILGFVLYRLSVGKVIIALLYRISDFVKKIIKKIIRLILLPLRFIIKPINKIYKKTANKIVLKIREEKTKRKKKKRKKVFESGRTKQR